MPELQNPNEPYLIIVDNHDRESRVFANDINDFGQEVKLEPKNYMKKAPDCGFTDYFSVKYNAISKMLYVRSDNNNIPDIPAELKFDLFINRTRFNLDDALHFNEGNLNIDFQLIDDSWETYSSVRVALNVGSTSSMNGCSFVSEIDWSNIDEVELVRDGDYFYLTYPIVDKNIIFNKEELDVEWYINDIRVSIESFDSNDRIYMPISRVNRLLNATSDKYTIKAKIPQLNTTLFSDIMFVNKICNFISKTTQVINGTSIVYNYQIINNNDSIKFAIYDLDSSELISSNEVYSFSGISLDTEISIVCYGIDDTIEANINNLVDGKYLGIKDDILVYTGDDVTSTFGNIIVTSIENTLVNNDSDGFEIDIRDISIGAQFSDCEYTGKFIPIEDKLNNFSVFKFSKNTTEPFDGMMTNDEEFNNVFDECLKSFPFSIGDFIIKKEVKDDN